MKKKVMIKQRELNVSLIFFFSIFSLFGQSKIEGTFCKENAPPQNDNCFIFSADGAFTYIKGGHGSTIKGSGTYKVTKNRLLLKYDELPPLLLSFHKEKIWESKNDSILIRLQVKDQKGIPISGTNVIYYEEQKNKKNGLILNERGEGELFLSKEKEPITLEISYLGYLTHTFTIPKNYSYLLEIYLSQEGEPIPLITNNEIFTIIKSEDNILKFMNNLGESAMWKRMKN